MEPENILIERLDASEIPDALDVLKQAFASHPMLLAGTRPEATEALMGLIVDHFGRGEDAWLHGIQQDGTLACVSLALDLRSEPRGLAMFGFFARMLRTVGWRLTRDFFLAFARQPRYEDPCLELILLGTLPASHKRGLGKAMLRFLYDLAKERGCRGIVLSVAEETPAYRFYLSEGFVADRVDSLSGSALYHMRRDL